MSIRKEAINAVYDKAYAIIQNDDMHARFDSIRKFVLADETLTEEEKLETIKKFDNDYDYFRVVWETGDRRICENCQQSCIARLYCEYCIRNYLEDNFSNWTSGSTVIDGLIKRCQGESLIPYMIVEWIPFNKFEKVKYLTRGGCSEIHSADWIDGCYKEWDNKEKKLKRAGKCKVVLKILENVEEANRDWLEEATNHLLLSNKWGSIVQCYGLSKHPSSEKYILVMNHMDIDLRKYIIQNRNQITWKTKIQIIFEVIKAIQRIHDEGSIHRDLHSGNVLYSQDKNDWYISDLGFCGPANKPLKSVYGNLPYIAPEILSNNNYSFKSDIYSIAMLMWELSSEQPPFIDYVHNYDLIINIINGMRPQFAPGTPSEYKELMTQCWDADPQKRPCAKTLWEKVENIYKSIHENDSYWNSTSNSPLSPNFNISNLTPTVISSLNSHSKIHNYHDLPVPKNATKDEQEYYTTQLKFIIPDEL